MLEGITNQKCVWQEESGGVSTLLTANFQSFGVFFIPESLTRLAIGSIYTPGSLSGLVQYFLYFNQKDLLEPSAQNNTDALNSVVRQRRVVYESSFTSETITLVTLPPKTTTFEVVAREAGDLVNFGSFQLTSFEADNIAPIGYSNITV